MNHCTDNQFEVKGKVSMAPGLNHLIQSISHKETGNLIVYTNRIFLSEGKSNSLVDFWCDHIVKEGRKMIIITPSTDGCRKLKEKIDDLKLDCVSVYLTEIITSNFVIEKNNVLFGVENLIEHIKTNSPSFTIKDSACRRYFVDYAKEVIKESKAIVSHDFDDLLLN